MGDGAEGGNHGVDHEGDLKASVGDGGGKVA